MPVTGTDLGELRRAIDDLPRGVTAALRRVAQGVAARERALARQFLIAQLKTSTRKLADHIEVVEDAPQKQFIVASQAPGDQPANLPIWNEYGTVKMSARPYMRPANDAVRDLYQREMESASAQVVARLLGD